MQKPQNYESIKVGDFTPIAPGGHLCVIKQVKEEKSKNGLDMLVISLDTDKTDAQPNYFTEQFKNDIRPDKKWGCVMYLVVDNSTEYGPENLKRFNTSVEESNTGFSVKWGDNYASCFKEKKVGVVFGGKIGYEDGLIDDLRTIAECVYNDWCMIYLLTE